MQTHQYSVSAVFPQPFQQDGSERKRRPRMFVILHNFARSFFTYVIFAQTFSHNLQKTSQKPHIRNALKLKTPFFQLPFVTFSLNIG